MTGKLHCHMYNRIHLQQEAGTSVVGYNAFYTHKIVQPDGLKNYGCSRASREFLVQDQKETKRSVQNLKAQQEAAGALSKVQEG